MNPYYLRIGHVDKVGKLLSVLVEDLNCESPVPHIGNRVQVSGDYFKVQEVVWDYTNARLRVVVYVE